MTSSADPALSEFYDYIVQLAARSTSPPQLLADLDAAGARFGGLAAERESSSLQESVEQFARHRLQLCDVESELAEAGNEVLVLSMALNDFPLLAAAALKVCIDALSHQLAAPGAVDMFAKLLRRLKAVATTGGDEHTLEWVKDVVAALPSE